MVWARASSLAHPGRVAGDGIETQDARPTHAPLRPQGCACHARENFPPLVKPLAHPVSAQVEVRGGRPTLLLNGVPAAPLLYTLSDCPGARWTWEEVPARNIRLFAAQGVQLFSCCLYLEQLLDAAGRLNLDLARRQIAGILAQCPGAGVMVRLALTAPVSWCERHPEECVGYADTTPEEPAHWGQERLISNDGERPVRASLASLVWRDWAAAHLRDFCTELAATPEGGALFALHLSNGLYGEWHQYGFLHHDPDTGSAATRSFRAWLAARYGDDAGLARAWHRPGAWLAAAVAPDSAARESADCGPLRDPRRHQDVIDYFTWLHTTTADSLLHLAAVVKRTWPRPIMTASFQGYFYGQFGRNAAGSHLALDRVLGSPHLDCLCSPQSYGENVRALGGSGHARGIIGSVRRAGKLWLDENDHGTSLVGCPWDRQFKSTLPDDVACLRRNVLQPVLRGGGQWWFDFGMVAGTPAFAVRGNIGWWDHPLLAGEIAALHRLAASRAGRPFSRPADTLVVHDPWSYAHTVARRWSRDGFQFGDQPPVGPDPFSGRATDGLLEGLFHSGLMFDDALVGELATLDLAPYRLIIFGAATALTAATRQVIAARVAQDGRHVVLTGYAGWGDTERIGGDLAAALSGIPTASRQSSAPTSRLLLDGASEEQTLEPPTEVPTYEAPAAHCIGHWADGAVSAAWREDVRATWWSFAVSPTKPALLRALGRRAGCHVLNAHDDVTTLGDGLLMIHSLTGGPREVHLPGGRALKLVLPPRSTTVLDATDGRVLLGPDSPAAPPA